MHDHRNVSIVLQSLPFCPNSYLIFQFIIINNGKNKKSVGKLEDKLIDEVLSLENFKNDINAKFSELNDHFNDFQAKYEIVNSNLSISRCCNDLLIDRITQLECLNLNNTQYNRRETLEINLVPSHIASDVLEQSRCQVLSLTRISVEPDHLQVCHCMRKKDQVIIKFKCRKQKHCVLSNC